MPSRVYAPRQRRRAADVLARHPRARARRYPLVVAPADRRRSQATSRARRGARRSTARPPTSTSTTSSTSSSSAAVRPASRRPSTAPPRGCRTVVLEAEAIGGQAGTSSMIRNYLGFPRGISGMRLAQRARNQAIRFGTRFFTGWSVDGAASPARDGEPARACCTDGGDVRARAVVVSTGVAYRRLGRRAHRGAGRARRPLRRRDDRRPRDGGPRRLRRRRRQLGRSGGACTSRASPGRSRSSCGAPTSPRRCRTTSSARSPTTRGSRVRACAEVVDGGGEGRLEWLACEDAEHRRADPARGRGLFLLLGAEPRCDWLPAASGPRRARLRAHRPRRAASSAGPTACRRRTSRPRCPASSLPATSAPGSMKRVAAASGEGASVVPLVHAWLAEGAAANGGERAALTAAMSTASRRGLTGSNRHRRAEEHHRDHHRLDVRPEGHRAVRRRQRVVTVDLQGHGRTADIDRPIDVRLMADDIAALIDHLGLDAPDIVGYSLGGGVALHTAGEAPGQGRQARRRVGEHPATGRSTPRCGRSRAR